MRVLLWCTKFKLTLLLCLSLSVAQADDTLCNVPSVRFGFLLESFPYLSRNEAEVGLKYWVDEIAKSQHTEVTIDYYKDFNQLSEDFRACKINFIAAFPWIIATKIERSLLSDGLVLIKSGNSTNKILMVVRKDEGVHNLNDLKGKRIGLMKSDAIAETYLDVLSMNELGKPYNFVFPKLIYESKKSQLLFNLFFNKIDAVLINQSNYAIAVDLNPQLREKTQIIYQSIEIANGTGFFNAKTPKDFREWVITTIVGLGDSARDQQLLAIFEADRFGRISVADLKGLDALKLQHQSLKNKYTRK